MTDWSTVPKFGVSTGRFPIQDRPSAYAIIPNAAAQLAVVCTAAGYYLPGGGIEGEESATTAVLREVAEECGLTVIATSWRAFATEVVCSEAEGTEFVKRSTFCEALLVSPQPVGSGEFVLEWQSIEAAGQVLAPASHRWAVREWAHRQRMPSDGSVV